MRKSAKAILAGFTCLFICQASFASHPIEQWQQRGPVPTTRELQDIAAGEGKHVVVFGDPAGRALVSNDGVAFTPEPLNLPQGLVATRILYEGGKWLVLASGRVWSKTTWSGAWVSGDVIPNGLAEFRALNGTYWGWSAGGSFQSDPYGLNYTWRNSVLYQSTDGLTWNPVSLSAAATDYFAITDMTHASGTYVLTNSALDDSSGVWTSADGVVWNGVSQLAGHFHSITFGNGCFVAGGRNGRMAISTNSVNWTTALFPFIGGYFFDLQTGNLVPFYSRAENLVFSNGKFIARSYEQGYPFLAESTDGMTWSSVTAGDADFQRAQATKLRQIGNQTYFLGQNGNLWRTTHWQVAHTQLLPLDAWDWTSVAASATRLVIAGEGGHVLWSDDVEVFHSLLLPDAADVSDLIWAPELSLFVAAGGDGTTARIWRSTDGINWTGITLPWFTGPATGLAWSGSLLMASGPVGQLAASTDGIQWSSKNSGVTSSLTSIEWGGGRFAATGNGGIVIHSTDGNVWNAFNLGPDTVTHLGLVFGNGQWIIAGGALNHQTTDFQTWWATPARTLEPNLLFAFGEFIGSNVRHIVGSCDGSNWQYYVDAYGAETPHGSGMHGFIRGTRFGNRVVFVGYDGIIGSSGEWRNFFQEWKVTHFTSEELNQAEISGANADPDKDGWSNAFEYAFDLDPKACQAWAKPYFTIQRDDNGDDLIGPHLYFKYPWALNRPGVSIRQERSRDLLNWTRDGMILGREALTLSDGRMWRVLYLPVSVGTPEFIRLGAEIVEP